MPPLQTISTPICDDWTLIDTTLRPSANKLQQILVKLTPSTVNHSDNDLITISFPCAKPEPFSLVHRSVLCAASFPLKNLATAPFAEESLVKSLFIHEYPPSFEAVRAFLYGHDVNIGIYDERLALLAYKWELNPLLHAFIHIHVIDCPDLARSIRFIIVLCMKAALPPRYAELFVRRVAYNVSILETALGKGVLWPLTSDPSTSDANVQTPIDPASDSDLTLEYLCPECPILQDDIESTVGFRNPSPDDPNFFWNALRKQGILVSFVRQSMWYSTDNLLFNFLKMLTNIGNELPDHECGAIILALDENRILDLVYSKKILLSKHIVSLASKLSRMTKRRYRAVESFFISIPLPLTGGNLVWTWISNSFGCLTVETIVDTDWDDKKLGLYIKMASVKKEHVQLVRMRATVGACACVDLSLQNDYIASVKSLSECIHHKKHLLSSTGLCASLLRNDELSSLNNRHREGCELRVCLSICKEEENNDSNWYDELPENWN